VTFNAIWGDDLPEPPEPWSPEARCLLLIVALLAVLVTTAILLNTYWSKP